MLILNESTVEIIVRFSSAIAKNLVTSITMMLNFLVTKELQRSCKRKLYNKGY